MADEILSITVLDAGARKAFDRISALGVPTRPMFAAIAGVMQSQILRTFRSQTDPVDGSPWPKTTDFTLASRPGGGGNGKTLSDTGQLLNSLVSAAPKISEDEVSLDTGALKYARIHQYGGEVTPQSAKFLAIPKTRRARLAGSPRRLTLGQGEKLSDHYVFAKRARIPRRRYVGVNDEMTARVRAVAGTFLQNEINRIVRETGGASGPVGT